MIDTNLSTWYNFGTNDALMEDTDRPNSGSPVPYIHIVLPAAITALGMDLFTTSPNALSYTITVAGNQYTVATNAQPNLKHSSALHRIRPSPPWILLSRGRHITDLPMNSSTTSVSARRAVRATCRRLRRPALIC